MIQKNILCKLQTIVRAMGDVCVCEPWLEAARVRRLTYPSPVPWIVNLGVVSHSGACVPCGVFRMACGWVCGLGNNCGTTPDMA